MADEPKPEDMINITGPEGETLFWHAKAWIAPGQSQLQAEIDDMWSHIGDLPDDRLVVLVGALCIENSIDALLGAIGPGFRTQDGADFTFSSKIKIARSLRMLPARILNSCDLIRQIRNEIAHNLEIKEFSHLDQKYLQRLGAHVTEFNTAERPPTGYRLWFRDLVSFTTLSLIVYSNQVERLREYLGTSVFREAFGQWIEKIQK